MFSVRTGCEEQIAQSDNRVAYAEPDNLGPGSVDVAGDVPSHTYAWSRSHQSRLGKAARAGGQIDGIDRRCRHPDSDLPLRRLRHRSVNKLKNLRATEPVDNN